MCASPKAVARSALGILIFAALVEPRRTPSTWRAVAALATLASVAGCPAGPTQPPITAPAAASASASKTAHLGPAILPLVPRPVTTSLGAETFPIDATTVIVASQGTEPIARLLASWLGIPANVRDFSTRVPRGAIELSHRPKPGAPRSRC